MTDKELERLEYARDLSNKIAEIKSAITSLTRLDIKYGTISLNFEIHDPIPASIVYGWKDTIHTDGQGKFRTSTARRDHPLQSQTLKNGILAMYNHLLKDLEQQFKDL